MNVGSLAPLTDGIVDGIQGALIVVGSDDDTLNIDDTGSTAVKTGTLTSTQLTGLAMGVSGITYSGIAALNISLGSGGNTFTISTTHADTVTTLNSGSANDTVHILATSGVTNVNGQGGDDTFNIRTTGATTTVNTGSGINTVNVGSLAPLGLGNVDGIQGALIILGNDSDTLNIDDTGSTTAKTALLTSTTLTGMGMGVAGIEYSGLATLNIKLGSGNDLFNIRSTALITSTTVTTGAGTDTVNVGTAGGLLNDILGALIVVGSGNDTLNVNASGNTLALNGTLTLTTLTGLGLGSAGITFSGLAIMNVTLGTGNDTFTINDVYASTVTTIDAGPGFDTAALDLTDYDGTLSLLNFEASSLLVSGNFSGSLVTGILIDVVIGGNFTSGAVLHATSIDTMTIGGDLAGLLIVDGLLNALTVEGGTPGKIVAGNINTIAVKAGYGNKVLQVVEGGVERLIEAIPAAGGTLARTVTFAFFYDSVLPGNPQLVIRITNGSPSTSSDDIRFDLSLVTRGSLMKFNLARVDTNGSSGIRNLTVEGDLLSTVTAASLTFLGLPLTVTLPITTQAGVYFANELIASIAVRDRLTIGEIYIGGIEAVAFGQLMNAKSGLVKSPVGDIGGYIGGETKGLFHSPIFATSFLALPATDIFRIPVGEFFKVRIYTTQHDLDRDLDYVMTLSDQLLDGKSVTFYLDCLPPPVGTVPARIGAFIGFVNSISVKGDGGAIDAVVPILGRITSTGPLGDIIVRGPNGIAGITAPSIFGNIKAAFGSINGTIETTGIRFDPITGESSTVSADLGRTLHDKKGKMTGVTTIHAAKGFTGNIIVRGNLISAFKADISSTGNISVEGNIGVLRTTSNGDAALDSKGRFTRFGGIKIAGIYSGQIVSLGNIFGDMTFSTVSGGILAKGAPVDGLSESRTGILGKVKISTLTLTGWVVSGGKIGDVTNGNKITIGTFKGVVAAQGVINGKFATTALVLRIQLGTPNGNVIDAIFTQATAQLAFDINLLDLAGLALIKTDLASLAIDPTGNLSGPLP